MAHKYIRLVPEIGMYGFSRSRATCKWKTPWCDRNCYFNKFYTMGWSKKEYDQLDEDWWQKVTPEEFCQEVYDSIGFEPPRFRFSVKGEIWNTIEDTTKVNQIAGLLPKTIFWIPTRAWHDSEMLPLLWTMKYTTPNVRVLCSFDPSDDPVDLARLRAMGQSVVFAGDNQPDQLQLVPGGVQPSIAAGMYRCEKTWEQRHGHCAVCEDGCFSKERVEVHLKKHQ